ncbi:Ca2+ regulator and membrane fusion protein Fig1-domain-containing protein [Clohesyomyces aquaticus]|uniref:Ca2+ regulator and membrane fusion protein Fig1-domain-containing protein n=1 Tax=Clohesyomyces aquaticus TaxID=1231657 RepID=A0A1Y1YHQ0_9PLEO|nr:Ca2+ regulator and membrane fusion protein Fig1-domain-containing protein [Clohesyomyces aquaticus]
MAQLKNRYSISFQRLVPFLGYHHFVICVILSAIICHCMLLAGNNLTASPLPSIHVLSLRYNVASSQSQAPNVTLIPSESINLQVRAGYFGICARSAKAAWTCAGTESQLPLSLLSLPDPYNIVSTGSRFRTDVLFPAFIIFASFLSFLAIVGLLTFPGWHSEVNDDTGSEVDVKPFPDRKVTLSILIALGFATPLAFAAALWQHTAAASVACLAETVSGDSVHAVVGGAAIALAWLPVFFLALAFVAAMVMYLSIRILDRLTDDN